MKREDAEKIIFELLDPNYGKLGTHLQKHKVCGSIRRKKEYVNDIDLVAIQKDESKYNFGDDTLNDTINKLDPEGRTRSSNSFLLGPKIKRFHYKGISIDLYLGDINTFETLVLIRTGSTQHNLRLTTLAKDRGLKLFASGKGLCSIKGGMYNNEPIEIIKVIETTEDGILQNLLGQIPTPEERN